MQSPVFDFGLRATDQGWSSAAASWYWPWSQLSDPSRNIVPSVSGWSGPSTCPRTQTTVGCAAVSIRDEGYC
eukprot:1582860-Rhodomonas_salina.1